MAICNKLQDRAPCEIEMLLPWHAAGTLNARDTRRVDEALARDPDLTRRYAAIREECAETVLLNESLGAPSPRAIHRLFAAIDAEPSRDTVVSPGLPERMAGIFARLSPRILGLAASAAAVVLLVQASVIGALLMTRDTAAPAAMSAAPSGIDSPPYALVRFAPEARVSDVARFIETYRATITEGGRGGVFRLQFGRKAMSKDEVAVLMDRLQHEAVISLAVAAQ